LVFRCATCLWAWRRAAADQTSLFGDGWRGQGGQEQSQKRTQKVRSIVTVDY